MLASSISVDALPFPMLNQVPNMDRIAETVHTRAQDGAMLGSQANFYRANLS